MVTAKATFKAVTRGNPCAISRGDHKCSRGNDGEVMCGRVTGPVPGFVFLKKCKDEQFSLYRVEGDPRLDDGDWKQRSNGNAHAAANGSVNHAALDWAARARQFARNLTPELRAELATVLGLPETCFAFFPG